MKLTNCCAEMPHFFVQITLSLSPF